MTVPKLPDPTKPSTRRIDIKPTTAAGVASEIEDPTKISTGDISRRLKGDSQSEEQQEKETA